MSSEQSITKEQLIQAIEKLEENQANLINSLTSLATDVGAGAVGMAAGGGAAAVLGTSTVFFGLITVAAPVSVVVGGAALGGLAVVGAKKFLLDGIIGKHGKKQEFIKNLQQKLKELEGQDTQNPAEEIDTRKFVIFLKEPLQLDLISPQNAQLLIMAVRNNNISLLEGYKMLEQIIIKPSNPHGQAKEPLG